MAVVLPGTPCKCQRLWGRRRTCVLTDPTRSTHRRQLSLTCSSRSSRCYASQSPEHQSCSHTLHTTSARNSGKRDSLFSKTITVTKLAEHSQIAYFRQRYVNFSVVFAQWQHHIQRTFLAMEKNTWETQKQFNTTTFFVFAEWQHRLLPTFNKL